MSWCAIEQSRMAIPIGDYSCMLATRFPVCINLLLTDQLAD